MTHSAAPLSTGFLRKKKAKKANYAPTDRTSDENESLRDLRTNLRHQGWDGVGRIGRPGRPGARSWLATYLGAKDTQENRMIGRAFLISLVARPFRPTMAREPPLVLVGASGTGKSSAVRVLNWHPSYPWIYDVEDEPRLTVAEFGASLHKTFVLTANEWPKNDEDEPELWPVKTGKIELAKLTTDVSQLLGEAFDAFLRGERDWEVECRPKVDAKKRLAKTLRLLTRVADEASR